jgi:uncharacterized membrane protein
MQVARPARASFAIASASLAFLSLAYGNFVPGQALPAWLPGRNILTYGAALIVLAASVGLCLTRTAKRSALVIGIYLAVWGAISTPPILAQPLSVGAWYGFVEALTSLVGAWILYAEPTAERSIRTAQVLFGLSCVFYGYSHFAYASYTASMVPGWLPGHVTLAYLTGAAHIGAGIGIATRMLPGLAAVLEASMMSLFGLLVWVPSFFAQPRPAWATPPQAQWSELVVNLILAAAAWIVAQSFGTQRSKQLPGLE